MSHTVLSYIFVTFCYSLFSYVYDGAIIHQSKFHVCVNAPGNNPDGGVLCVQEAAVKNTPLFLQYLTEQMHERVPGSLVLWYDSVLEKGELKWQNELNESNR